MAKEKKAYIRDFVLGRYGIYRDATSYWRSLGMALYQGYIEPSHFESSNASDIPEEITRYKDYSRVEEVDITGKVVGYRRKYTINLTRMIANHIRTLIMNEGTEINVKNDDNKGTEEEPFYEKREFFSDVMDNNNFFSMEAEMLEWAVATGDNLKVIYLDKEEDDLMKKVKINFLKGDKFIVTGHENGIVKSVVVTTSKVREEKNKDDKIEKLYYTLLEYHYFDKKIENYVIMREIYKGKQKNQLETFVDFKEVALKIFNLPDEMEEEYIDIDEPMFVYHKMPFVNNKEKNAIRGIGATINAIDEMDAVNTSFDLEITEAIDTKARIVTPETFIESEHNPETGKMERRFNQNTRIFLAVNDQDQQMNKFEIFAPPSRVDAYEKLIENNSKRFAKSVGLDPNYFHLNPQSKATATQVKIENKASHDLRQEIIRTMKKTWRDLFYIIYKYAKKFNIVDFELEKKDIVIEFPDGIIEDDKVLFERDIAMLKEGIISKQRLREKWVNLNRHESDTEEERIEYENRIKTIVEMLNADLISKNTAIKLAHLKDFDLEKALSDEESILFEEIRVAIKNRESLTNSEIAWYKKQVPERLKIEHVEDTPPQPPSPEEMVD